MKEFKITEQQLNMVASIFLELPAKTVINALDTIRSLPVIEKAHSESIENKE